MFLKTGVDLILFCGGDGTARDIFDEVGRNVPILGIPPVSRCILPYLPLILPQQQSVAGYQIKSLRDSEVMDVDEEAYRAGELKTQLHGIAAHAFAR